MTAGLPLMKNILTPLGKSILILLVLTAAAITDATIQKKIYGSGTIALIISYEKMADLTKIVKPLEESGLLIKRVSETIKNEPKEQKSRFLPILLGTLAASILGNALTGKGVIRADEGIITAGQNFCYHLIL